jgi:glycosyltransferase 2 family protein
MIKEQTGARPTPGVTIPTRKLNRKRLFIRLGGTALLLFFIWKLHLNLGQVASDLLRANLWALAAAILLIMPIMVLKTWRWRMILAELGLKVPFGPAYRLYAVGLSAGSFTPGQLGDAVKAWYLRDRGYPLGSSLVSIVLDRLLDVVVLALLAIGSLLVLGSAFIGELPSLLVLLVGVVGALVVFAVPVLRQRLLRLGPGLIRRKQQRYNTSEEVLTIQNPRLGKYLACFGLTLATAGIAIIRTWLLAYAIGLNFDFMEVIAASSLATAAGLIPISVSGVGVRDLTLIGIMGKLGYARESAVSLSTLLLMLNLVNLVVGYAIWATRPDRPAKTPQ